MSKELIRNPQSESQSQCDSSTVFAAYARYYNLLYKDKNYAAEADYVAGLIRKFNPNAQSILELGSGTGIHACLLAQKGFRVHGIERSEEMITIARANASSFHQSQPQPVFTKGDIREIRLSQSFDAVIALFHVISYQTTNEDVTAAFETARQHMNPGGVFIFDVWYGPAVLTERPAVRIKRTADDQIEVTRLAEPVLHPNENLVDVNYHIFVRDMNTGVVKELKETHIIRYFFKPELDLFAEKTGFKIVHTEEWLTGRPIGQNTWGVCFILKAF